MRPSINIGDVVRLGQHVGVVTHQEGTWSHVLWENKTEYYSGGPQGPPGQRKVDDAEVWPTDYLAPNKGG